MFPPPGTGVAISKDLALRLLKIHLSHLGDPIQFLEWLARNRRRYEALILCCCYIDGLGRYIYAAENLGSHRGFVRVLREYGEDPILPLVHPRHMMITLNRRARRNKTIAVIRQSIDPLLQGCALVNEDDFLASARPLLSNDQYAVLKDNAWRGTMAAIAYDIRSIGVHEAHGPSGMSYGNTTYQGKEAPMVNYEMLWPALNRIYAAAERLCAHVVL